MASPAGPGSRKTESRDARPRESSPHESFPFGLAPREARAWLALQAELAWQPEKAGPLLRSGRSPESILRELAVAGVPSSGAASAERESHGGDRAIARLARLGARVLPLTDPAYPPPLRALEDAPLVLVVRGGPESLARPAVAIVGARAATRAACRFTRRLAYDLARAGLTIVSGLARGIDAEAHRGALEAGGATIGVLACGIDRIYPPEHRALAEEIVRSGALVSELPVGALPRPLHFPLRNRIISGLSRAVVVVEACRRSGSLITVRHALTQGREVFVVPGAVDGPFASGTNQLLREGARAIQSARDLLDDLGLELTPTSPGTRRARRAQQAGGEPSTGSPASPLEERLVALLAEGPRTADELLLEAELDPGRLATALLELELAGRVAEERDGRLHLCRVVDVRDPTGPSLPCAPSRTDAPTAAASLGDSSRDRVDERATACIRDEERPARGQRRPSG